MCVIMATATMICGNNMRLRQHYRGGRRHRHATTKVKHLEHELPRYCPSLCHNYFIPPIIKLQLPDSAEDDGKAARDGRKGRAKGRNSRPCLNLTLSAMDLSVPFSSMTWK